MPRSVLRTTAVTVVCAGLLLGGAPGPALAEHPAESGGISSKQWADRATDAYRALQTHLYQGTDEHGLYLEHTPRQDADPEYSYLWPLREAAAATVDLQRLPDIGPD